MAPAGNDTRIRLLLLDFDGTLADTRRANTLAYVAALGEAGYPLTGEEYAAVIRSGDYQVQFGILKFLNRVLE